MVVSRMCRSKLNTCRSLLFVLSSIALQSCHKTSALTVDYFVNVQPSAVLRAEPSVKSTKVVDLEFGTKVQIIERTQTEVLILGTNGFWFKVKTGDKEGWIFSRLLRNHTKHPTKVMYGQLVSSEWKAEPLPKVEKKLPSPPSNCENIEHYLFARLKPISDLQMKKNSPSMTWTRQRKYENKIIYTNTYGMDWYEEQVELPGIDNDEALIIAQNCPNDGPAEAITKKKNGGLRSCQTFKSENDRARGFKNIETLITPTGVVLFIRSSAHEACPKLPLH